MSKEKVKNDNPFNYGYKPNTKLETTGEEFDFELYLLNKEVNSKSHFGYPIKTEWLKDGESVEEGTEGAQEVFDPIATLESVRDSEPVQFITEDGVEFLHASLNKFQKHAKNIEDGVAVKLDDLKNKKVD